MLPDVGTSQSVHEGKMDTSGHVGIETSSHTKRRRRTVEEKCRIVEETLEAGASVARVARRHAVNANQVFYWRKKYREGRLGKNPSSNLLPVTVSDVQPNKSGSARDASKRCSAGVMEIKLPKGQLRVTGNVDAEALGTVLEYLLR
jgi:transposase